MLKLQIIACFLWFSLSVSNWSLMRILLNNFAAFQTTRFRLLFLTETATGMIRFIPVTRNGLMAALDICNAGEKIRLDVKLLSFRH